MLKPKEAPTSSDDRHGTVKTNFKIDKIVTPANVKIDPVPAKDAGEPNLKLSQPINTPAEQPAAAPAPVAAAGKRNNSLKRLAGLTLGLAVVIGALLALQSGPDTPAETAAVAPTPAPTPSPEPATSVLASAAVAAPAPAPVSTPEAKAPSATDQLLAQMTAGTLAALRKQTEATAAATTAAAPAAESSALYALVLKAVSQGQSDAYVDRLLNEAHKSGEVTIPAALIRQDGSVDTATILTVFTGN